MGDIVAFERRAAPSQQARRLALIEDWSNAWTDPSLDALVAYDTGRLIGDACAALIAENYVASQWLLAELLEIGPTNQRQHSIRSGIVDAIARALGGRGAATPPV